MKGLTYGGDGMTGVDDSISVSHLLQPHKKMLTFGPVGAAVVHQHVQPPALGLFG